MLDRGQLLAVFNIFRERGKCMPSDLIQTINEFSLDHDTDDFRESLRLVAYGELEEVQAMLEKANQRQGTLPLKNLLLIHGTAVTPAGLTVKHTTLLECALGSGDPEMIELIKSYFSRFKGGENEKEKQLARYRACIEDMENQKPDDLSWLFYTIKKASNRDVFEELKTGNDYDPSYKSTLREVLNKFREEKLDPKVRTITKPCMHCNYQNLQAAYDLFNAEWTELTDEITNEKCYLIARQVIGFLELVELPAYERYLFARGQANKAIEGKAIERSLHYIYDPESFFPPCDISVIKARSGIGFDSYISIDGDELWQGISGIERVTFLGESLYLKELYQKKIVRLKNLCSTNTEEKENRSSFSP